MKDDRKTWTDFFAETIDRSSLALMVSIWPELSVYERKVKAPLLANDPEGLRDWVTAGAKRTGMEPGQRIERALDRDRFWNSKILQKTKRNSRDEELPRQYKVGALTTGAVAMTALKLANPMAMLRGPRQGDEYEEKHSRELLNPGVRAFLEGPVLGGASMGFLALAVMGHAQPNMYCMSFAAILQAGRLAFALRSSNLDGLVIKSVKTPLATFSRHVMASAIGLAERTRQSRARSALIGKAPRVPDFLDSLARASIGDAPAPEELIVVAADAALADKAAGKEREGKRRLADASNPSLVFGKKEERALSSGVPASQLARKGPGSRL